MKFLWKGQLIEKEAMQIDYNDRGYNFGDGLYEFVRVYNGKLFALEEHLDRMEFSAKLLEMNLYYTREELRNFFIDLVEANQVKGGHVYIQLTRGDGAARNHNFPILTEQQPVISGNTAEYARNSANIENGVKAILYPDIRWQMCNAKSLNLLPNCLAIHEAKKVGADKAIMYRDSFITEERAGNVMIVKDGEAFTTPDGPEILQGITKLIVLRLCRKLGIPYEEKKFTVKQLLEADEVIVMDSKTECAPIIQVGETMIGTGKRGPIAARLDQAYQEAIVRECGRVM